MFTLWQLRLAAPGLSLMVVETAFFAKLLLASGKPRGTEIHDMPLQESGV
ncbi:hypothetical protein [Pseudogemmobacter faecipullorum]|uniref:Uncharacterized protein n=1 Tax=Pseudogemmobacter faecipullorum TaxID=2755041 RepID=A0ABS8CH60_9RHOB|nr:hypothetical protein [Pseudogemmobacter faecipullorum]MCB5408732.1 hypothetical protein [Pseudogemmobacter faecipullorum]